jgi:hypothetical protein
MAESLDRLGIALLELRFGTVLEEQPHRKRWHEGKTDQEKAVFDVMAARDWQCEVLREVGSAYSEAGYGPWSNRAASALLRVPWG